MELFELRITPSTSLTDILINTQLSPANTYSECFPSPQEPPSFVLRPTPHHPGRLADDDQPLDLSKKTTVIQTTVIQEALASPIYLPKCQDITVETEWIASGAPLSGNSAVSPGANRMSYPREFKLMVIDYYSRNGMNKYRTCKQFQITKSMLNGWLAKVDKIRESRPGSLKSGRSGRKPQFPDIEQELYRMYEEETRRNNCRLDNKWLKVTARNLSEQYGAEANLSERWLTNFKKRHNIRVNRTQEKKDQNDDGKDMESYMEETDKQSGGTYSDSDSEIIGEASKGAETRTQLPIEAFYDKYPWLCRKTSQMEPGRRGRKVQFPEVEQVLYGRLLTRQREGQRISNKWLQDEAREIALQLCPDVLEEATKTARCMFSEHWLHNFKKRFAVSLKHRGDPKERTGLGTVNEVTRRKYPSLLQALQPRTTVTPASTEQTIASGPYGLSSMTFPTDVTVGQNLMGMLNLQNWLLAKCLPQTMPDSTGAPNAQENQQSWPLLATENPGSTQYATPK